MPATNRNTPSASLFIVSPIASKAKTATTTKQATEAKVTKGEVSAICLFANRVFLGEVSASKDNVATAKTRLARVAGVGDMDLSTVFAAGAVRMSAPSFIRVGEDGSKSVARFALTAPASYVAALRYLASL